MNERDLTPRADPALEAWAATVRAYESAARLLERRLSPDGLSIAKFDALAAIDRLGEATQQAVADELLVSKAGLATMLTRLERDGLVSRRANRSDARSRLVSLTPDGGAALRRALHHQAGVIAVTVATLSDDSQRRLRTTMERLLTAVSAASVQDS